MLKRLQQSKRKLDAVQRRLMMRSIISVIYFVGHVARVGEVQGRPGGEPSTGNDAHLRQMGTAEICQQREFRQVSAEVSC